LNKKYFKAIIYWLILLNCKNTRYLYCLSFKAFHLKKHINRKSLIGYFFAASTGVLVQYIVAQMICIRQFNIPYETAILIGFVVSFPVGFILSKIFAFQAKKSGNTRREMIKFLMVLVVSGFITVKGSALSLYILTSLFGNIKATIPIINQEFSPVGSASHFAGMGMSFIFNFFTHRKFTFVETGILDKIIGNRN
jgi:putative flippase GtrA